MNAGGYGPPVQPSWQQQQQQQQLLQQQGLQQQQDYGKQQLAAAVGGVQGNPQQQQQWQRHMQQQQHASNPMISNQMGQHSIHGQPGMMMQPQQQIHWPQQEVQQAQQPLPWQQQHPQLHQSTQQQQVQQQPQQLQPQQQVTQQQISHAQQLQPQRLQQQPPLQPQLQPSQLQQQPQLQPSHLQQQQQLQQPKMQQPQLQPPQLQQPQLQQPQLQQPQAQQPPLQQPQLQQSQLQQPQLRQPHPQQPQLQQPQPQQSQPQQPQLQQPQLHQPQLQQPLPQQPQQPQPQQPQPQQPQPPLLQQTQLQRPQQQPLAEAPPPQQQLLQQQSRVPGQYPPHQQSNPVRQTGSLGAPVPSAEELRAPNGYPEAAAAPGFGNQAAAWGQPPPTAQPVRSSPTVGDAPTGNLAFAPQQQQQQQQQQPQQQMQDQRQHVPPQQQQQQQRLFYSAGETQSATMQQQPTPQRPAQDTQGQRPFQPHEQQYRPQQQYQQQHPPLQQPAQQQPAQQQQLLPQQQLQQQTLQQQQQQRVMEPTASQQPQHMGPPPVAQADDPSKQQQQLEQWRQQQYNATHRNVAQPLQQERRAPSLMGIGTGSFPASAEPNGVKSSPDRAEHGQKRQQQEQQEQQDSAPEDMPPLQPLARPINNRIDPAHIPRPEWNDQITNVYGKRIETDKAGASPPSPAGFYTAIDKGCCSCRFMRSTINQVPAFSHSLELSRLPFAIIVTPFAAQPPTEEAVPLVDLRISKREAEQPYSYGDPAATAAAHQDAADVKAQTEFFGGYVEVQESDAEEDTDAGSSSGNAASAVSSRSKSSSRAGASSEGIVRCSNCMAYLSPFMSWASNSTHCLCNLCGSSFELPPFYLTLLDRYRSGLRASSSGMGTASAEGERYSRQRRQELWKGSVDFVAPRAFSDACKLTQLQHKRREHLLKLLRMQGEVTRQHQLRQQQLHQAEQQGIQQQLDGTSLEQPQMQLSSWGRAQAGVSSRADADSQCGDFLPRNYTSSNSSSLRPCIVFVIDATAASLTSGLSHAAATGLEQALRDVYLQVDICLILVSDRLYFIPNTNQTGQQQQRQQGLQLLVVDDVSDPFLPAPVEHCFFRPQDRDELLWAVSLLPAALNNCVNISHASAANAALKVAVDLIAERSAGGMVEMFYCVLPDVGVGALKQSAKASEGPAKSTEIHQQDFYNSIVTQCFAACTCVDVYACPPPNVTLELQSLGFPAQQTGGDIRFVPEFCGSRDKEWVAAEMRRIFTSCFYFDVEFKLRLSKGLAVDRILVSFSGARSLVDQSTFRLPRLNAQSTLLFQLKHTEQLETQKNVYAQSVCAYTPMHPSKRVPNRRLLRVHSLSLPITFSLASLFRYAEVDATAFLLARTSAIMELHQEPQWREKAIKNLVEILSAYRINCASASSEGQLILPDSLKLLPVYLQALFKHAAFRQSTVDPQVRLFQLLQFLRMSISEFSTHLYPRLCLLHKSYLQPSGSKERKALDRVGEYSGVENFVWMPQSLPASGTNILSDGVYLCEAGSYMLLYIGQHVRREYIIDLFGFDAQLDERSTAELRLQNVEGTAGERILRVVEQIRFEKFDAPFIPLRIVAPKSYDETRLLTHLIEDPLSGDGSYVDFLCDLHKRVHARMEDT